MEPTKSAVEAIRKALCEGRGLQEDLASAYTEEILFALTDAGYGIVRDEPKLEIISQNKSWGDWPVSVLVSNGKDEPPQRYYCSEHPYAIKPTTPEKR